MAEVIVTIKPNGETTVQVEGHQGPSCSLVSAPYRKALGKEIASHPTAEMFETNAVQQELRQ